MKDARKVLEIRVHGVAGTSPADMLGVDPSDVYGMLLASRDPARHRTWIVAMIGVQALDWVSTIAYLATGTSP